MSTVMRENSSGSTQEDYRSSDRQDELTPEISELSTGATGKLFTASTQMRSVEASDRVDQLRRAIEGEIIPRLMLVAKSDSGEIANASRSRSKSGPSKGRSMVQYADPVIHRREIDQREIETFARLLQRGSMTAINGYVARLQARGHTTPELLLQLFAPTARHLGRLWETDACDFAIVTLAMGCLQQALRTLDNASDSGHRKYDGRARRTILLAPAAGEQHTFPIQILDVFFRRAGWAVIAEVCFCRDRIAQTMRDHAIDAAGLSISRDLLLDQLAADIKFLRGCSFNRSPVILVGGRVFEERPELAKQIGADATAPDAAVAVRVAERLVSNCTPHALVD